MTKKELRSVIKQKRAALTDEYKKKSDEKIQQLVLSCHGFSSARSVFVYVSTENEPDTRLIIENALSAGKRVYVPRCISKGKMVAVEIKGDTVFEEGYMGIKEPLIYDDQFNISELDFSVIPCVSASFSGKRLGHGAGFYDIFLESVKTQKVCLCYDKLSSEDIPTDNTDILMDAVITEEGIFYCKDSINN